MRPPRPAIWRRRLAWAGLPLGCGVGIYTGVLPGVLVARPLWNTPLLAQLFLVSAISSAAALLLLLTHRKNPQTERHVLARADAVLIAVELTILAWMLVDGWTSTASSQAAVAVLTHGAHGWLLWLSVILVGLFAPLGLELTENTRTARRLRLRHAWVFATLPPVLVLIGGFLLRLVIVNAGQTSGLT